MNKFTIMLKIGLTGNIGAGKSYIASKFEELGIPVFNSDESSKKILEWPKVIDKIEKVFGESVVINATIDKEQLGNIVFNNKSYLKELQDLLYPYVEKDLNSWYAEQEAKEDVPPYVIVESAIILENNKQDIFDKIITVIAPKDIRIERVIERNGSKEYFERAEKNQLKQNEKIKIADYVIQNDNKEDVIEAIKEIHEEIIS